MVDITISLDKLSEPLTKLVEVTSAGIGHAFKPFVTVRQARADATAKVIAAIADMEVLDIHERAKRRIEHRESLRQENIEKVFSIAAGEIPETVSSEPVDLDWSLQFFDTIQDVCDDEMQSLWARILAGEVSQPGSYSKRTLQFLKTLDKFEAEKFVEFCSLVFQRDDGWCFVVDLDVTRKMIVEKSGNYDLIRHFAAIGLISDELWGSCDSWDKIPISYFQSNYEAVSIKVEYTGGIKKLNNKFAYRYFTQIGQQLFRIANAKKVEEYPEKISTTLAEQYNLSLRKVN